MKAEVFTGLPNELKTIEIDVEKRKFLINGESFGHSREFSLEIVCKASEGYEVSLKANSDVKFKGYTMKGKEKTADTCTSGSDIKGF